MARAPFFSFWRAANTHAQPTAAKETHTRTHSRAVTFGASIGTLQYQQPPHYTGGAVDNLASQKASQPASLLVSEPCQAAVAFAIGSSFKLSCIVSSTSSSPSPLPLLLHHRSPSTVFTPRSLLILPCSLSYCFVQHRDAASSTPLLSFLSLPLLSIGSSHIHTGRNHGKLHILCHGSVKMRKASILTPLLTLLLYAW